MTALIIAVNVAVFVAERHESAALLGVLPYGGIVAMLAQIAASPHSTIPNLGASGAIAAVMGAVKANE